MIRMIQDMQQSTNGVTGIPTTDKANFPLKDKAALYALEKDLASQTSVRNWWAAFNFFFQLTVMPNGWWKMGLFYFEFLIVLFFLFVLWSSHLAWQGKQQLKTLCGTFWSRPSKMSLPRPSHGVAWMARCHLRNSTSGQLWQVRIILIIHPCWLILFYF